MSLPIQALKLINLLVIDSGSQLLSEQVSLLDPFPEAPPFLDLCTRHAQLKETLGHTSLKQEIERFLVLGCEATQAYRTEGVRSLRKRLGESKSDLRELTRVGLCNLVSRLIQELVSLCRQSRGEGQGSPSQELVMEVARCLGEIGTVDLGSIALVAVDSNKCGGEWVQCMNGCNLFWPMSDLDLSLFGREWNASEQVVAQVFQLLSRLLMDEE